MDERQQRGQANQGVDERWGGCELHVEDRAKAGGVGGSWRVKQKGKER